MKSRVRRIANFFAFNLLFFALYLNFIHQENDNALTEAETVQKGVATSQVTNATPLQKSQQK